MIIAGESSGDFHSALLIQALKEINPDLNICGMGGERMRQAGAEILFDIRELSIIGFTGVLTNFTKIQRRFNQLLAKIDQLRPEAVILVDYPGFNLKLAKEVKKRKIPVIYYISPQIWAWWKGRIKQIERSVDKMIVIFKFEQALYQDYGINVSFVGHPLLDIAQVTTSKDEFLNKLGLPDQNLTIALMPGSRKMEVERILPVLLESARIIKEKLPQAQFAVLKAADLPKEIFVAELKKYNLPIVLCENQTYNLLNASSFALVASGTATLETAIMQTPMVVVYKVSFLNWLIAKSLIKVPFIGLVNVVAGKLIVPEFIQHQAKPTLIAQCVLEILNNPSSLTNVKNELKAVREALGTAGASKRAAAAILEHLS
ncbi:MAG: lipid-A-disaccharide synthase [Candidatus Omnitrophica bacterium]|nr:lipid-A-disaccharide synthase [Candidatus Omnitrophota bacterium]